MRWGTRTLSYITHNAMQIARAYRIMYAILDKERKNKNFERKELKMVFQTDTKSETNNLRSKM